MNESTLITDVRTAKEWVDRQCPQWNDLADRLRAIEKAYATRAGEYSAIPAAWPESVRAAIAQAADDPGQSLLSETRPARPA